MSEAEVVTPPIAMTRLGEIYEALEITPDGDARTVLLDELREELGRMHQGRCADGDSV